VDVVAGSIMPGLVELRRRIAGMHNDVELHVDTEDMAVLMARADMAIGAAGVTAWERCALGLPTLIVIAADNQRANAAALAERGAAQVLGWHADISGEAIARGIGELCSDPSRRERMSRAAIGMCDGRGTARLAEAMCP
jgi:spore coat polysaccharide biosynthesis predicted glycosyltransferase SpsG